MNEANVVLEVVDAVVNAIPLVIPGAAVAFIGLDCACSAPWNCAHERSCDILVVLAHVTYSSCSLAVLLPNGVRSLVDGEEGTGFAAIDPTAPQTPEEIIYKITFAALTVGSLIFSYIVYS
jgi:hypothetical protein